MARYFAWIFLIAIFLLSGEGFNLLRLAIMQKLAEPHSSVWLQASVGTILLVGGLTFLGGLIFYRDRKHGRIKRPNLRQ